MMIYSRNRHCKWPFMKYFRAAPYERYHVKRMIRGNISFKKLNRKLESHRRNSNKRLISSFRLCSSEHHFVFEHFTENASPSQFAYEIIFYGSSDRFGFQIIKPFGSGNARVRKNSHIRFEYEWLAANYAKYKFNLNIFKTNRVCVAQSVELNLIFLFKFISCVKCFNAIWK